MFLPEMPEHGRSAGLVGHGPAAGNRRLYRADLRRVAEIASFLAGLSMSRQAGAEL
jgi:hypothetical protein